MKRFLSLFLALVMSLSLAAPVFAADGGDGDDGDYGIMPLLQVFPDHLIQDTGRYESSRFTATASNGHYIQVWFQNLASNSVRLYLHRVDSGRDEIVKVNDRGDQYLTIGTMCGGFFVYDDATAGSGTYYVVIEAPNNGTIYGRIAVAQYNVDPRLS